MKIILASGSPRRAELLTRIGLKFEVIRPLQDEISHKTHPGEYVEELASQKSSEVELKVSDPQSLIIASDTIVWFENKILEKPNSKKGAIEMLTSMSGSSHQVYTAVSCRYQGEEMSFYETTHVEFHSLSQAFIERYVDTGEPMDKAGSYGIQDMGQVLVKGIEGNFANVMGFPTSRFYLELNKWLGDKSPI